MTRSKSKTYFLTGTAGFIGARTATLLLEAGHTVIGLDNINNAYDTQLKQARLTSLQEQPNFIYQQGDIEDLPTLQQLFRKYSFDAVFNLAARAGVRYSVENPFAYYRTNVLGTLNILECMREYEGGKLVLASTSSLYAGQPMPYREELPVDTPISPYAASKKAAETMAYSYHYLHGIDVSIVRYFTVYGPAGRPDMGMYRFIEWIANEQPIQLFGDGSQKRDFTYIDDIARGTILAAKPLGYEIINLGGGQAPVTITELLNQIGRLLNKPVKITYLAQHQADMEATAANIAKAKRLLGWEPRVPLELGLKGTIDWHQDNCALTMKLRA